MRCFRRLKIMIKEFIYIRPGRRNERTKTRCDERRVFVKFKAPSLWRNNRTMKERETGRKVELQLSSILLFINMKETSAASRGVWFAYPLVFHTYLLRIVRVHGKHRTITQTRWVDCSKKNWRPSMQLFDVSILVTNLWPTLPLVPFYNTLATNWFVFNVHPHQNARNQRFPRRCQIPGLQCRKSPNGIVQNRSWTVFSPSFNRSSLWR